MTFTNAPATGVIVATVLDGEGNPVDGVCVTVSAEGIEPVTLCEAAEGGVFRFEGLAPADYTVAVSQVPEQYVTPDPLPATVTAGQETTVAFEPGRRAARDRQRAGHAAFLEDGQAAAGQCIALTNQETGARFGPSATTSEGQDGDATQGVILLQEIPVGSYEVTFPDAGASSRQGLQGEPITIEILAGQTIEVEITVPGLFILGAIEVRTVDAATGEDLAGACFDIGAGEVCDGGAGDASTEAGTVLFTGLPAGDYTVSMTTPPDGMGAAAADQTATVTSGETTPLMFEVEAEVTTGTLTISKVDGAGEALPGACFRLENGDGGTVAQVCDEADGDSDGTITFSDAPPAPGGWSKPHTGQPVPGRSAARCHDRRGRERRDRGGEHRRAGTALRDQGRRRRPVGAPRERLLPPGRREHLRPVLRR